MREEQGVEPINEDDEFNGDVDSNTYDEIDSEMN